MKAGDTAGAARTGGRVSAIPRDVSCGTNRLNVPRSRSAALQGCLSGRWQAERPALREPTNRDQVVQLTAEQSDDRQPAARRGAIRERLPHVVAITIAQLAWQEPERDP